VRGAEYEVQRQAARYVAGQPVEQETRGFNVDTGTTFRLRSKEEARDYRYMPEPDVPDVIVTPELVEALRASLPELPPDRVRRYVATCQLKPEVAVAIVAAPGMPAYFEAALQALNNERAHGPAVANWYREAPPAIRRLCTRVLTAVAPAARWLSKRSQDAQRADVQFRIPGPGAVHRRARRACPTGFRRAGRALWRALPYGLARIGAPSRSALQLTAGEAGAAVFTLLRPDGPRSGGADGRGRPPHRRRHCRGARLAADQQRGRAGRHRRPPHRRQPQPGTRRPNRMTRPQPAPLTRAPSPHSFPVRRWSKCAAARTACSAGSWARS